MRISELSDAAGVPVPTIKYYLREGLLPKGEHTAATRADYDARHVRGLRLIRVLTEIGGLPLASVRAIVAAVAQPETGVHDLIGGAQWALGPRSGDEPSERHRRARAGLDRLLGETGWRVSEYAPARALVAEAMAGLDELGVTLTERTWRMYLRTADTLATDDLSYLSDDMTREDLVTHTVALTVLTDRLLVGLRRLAQEHASAEKFGEHPPPGPGTPGGDPPGTS